MGCSLGDDFSLIDHALLLALCGEEGGLKGGTHVSLAACCCSGLFWSATVNTAPAEGGVEGVCVLLVAGATLENVFSFAFPSDRGEGGIFGGENPGALEARLGLRERLGLEERLGLGERLWNGLLAGGGGGAAAAAGGGGASVGADFTGGGNFLPPDNSELHMIVVKSCVCW